MQNFSVFILLYVLVFTLMFNKVTFPKTKTPAHNSVIAYSVKSLDG